MKADKEQRGQGIPRKQILRSSKSTYRQRPNPVMNHKKARYETSALNLVERQDFFDEVLRLPVSHRQGSTSTISEKEAHLLRYLHGKTASPAFPNRR